MTLLQMSKNKFQIRLFIYWFFRLDKKDYVEKQRINPKNDDGNWFQYVAAIVLNHKKIELHSKGF